MTEARVVAIWIGDHRDELDLDQYITEQFEAEYGFSMNDRMMPEIVALPEPVVVADLLRGFSMWEHWHADAIAKCADMGIEGGSSAIVFHFLRYDYERCSVAGATTARFIGNFHWPENQKS